MDARNDGRFGAANGELWPTRVDSSCRTDCTQKLIQVCDAGQSSRHAPAIASGRQSMTLVGDLFRDVRVIGILSTAEIEAVLSRNRIGRIAMCADARPYVLPVSYRYDGISVFGFSGPGRKIETMRAQPNVALLVDEIHSPTTWKSVILEGVFEELTEPEERRHAYTALSTNGSSILPRGIMVESGLVLYRVRPTAKSGRFETSES